MGSADTGDQRIYAPLLFLRCLHMPEIERVIPTRAVLDMLGLERFPLRHVEIVRDDTRTGFHLFPDVRPDHQIYFRQKIHGQHVIVDGVGCVS